MYASMKNHSFLQSVCIILRFYAQQTLFFYVISLFGFVLSVQLRMRKMLSKSKMFEGIKDINLLLMCGGPGSYPSFPCCLNTDQLNQP